MLQQLQQPGELQPSIRAREVRPPGGAAGAAGAAGSGGGVPDQSQTGVSEGVEEAEALLRRVLQEARCCIQRHLQLAEERRQARKKQLLDPQVSGFGLLVAFRV